MALYSVKGSKNIPEGAIRVTKEEALSRQKALIRDWKKHSDVIFLRYGKHLAGLLTTCSSVIVTHHFVKKFKTGPRGVLYMILPGILLPTICTMLYFDKYITNKVLLLQNDCPMCFLFPFGAVQFINGVLTPAVTGITSGLTLAQSLHTISVPNSTDRKKFFKFVVDKIIKPGSLKFQGLVAVNVLSMLFFPYEQNNELLNVMKELERMET